jgi:surfeit locus 1 family protein
MARYRFKPKLGMTLATIVVMAICIKLGSWQYIKAQNKIALQQKMEQGLVEQAVRLPAAVQDVEAWRYKRVVFEGVYEPKYQILLDNRVNDNVVGYHVLTPMKIEGSQTYVLVNRGWIAGNLNREVPAVDTPTGKQALEGDIVFPLKKVFTLEAPLVKDGPWQMVWQHINMQRYKETVPFAVEPYVVRLAADSGGGGFARNWPIPKDRITVHLGYAYQWFGFALTLLVIYIVLNLKRVNKESENNE